VILSNVASSWRSLVSGVESCCSSSASSSELDVVVVALVLVFGRMMFVFCSIAPVC
jgi:hypothetical protein